MDESTQQYKTVIQSDEDYIAIFKRLPVQVPMEARTRNEPERAIFEPHKRETFQRKREEK
jgi:hypothetical protein